MAAGYREELTEFVRGQHTHIKAPDRVYFETLPKTSTGKIQKHVLRAMAQEEPSRIPGERGQWASAWPSSSTVIESRVECGMAAIGWRRAARLSDQGEAAASGQPTSARPCTQLKPILTLPKTEC